MARLIPRLPFAFTALMLVFSGHPSTANDSTDAENAIRATIGSQLDAFQKDDWVRAFGFASPNIQGMFGDPERFSEMVRGGYPMVWRPRRVEFGELRATERGIAQRMIFVGPEGQLHLADYFMVLVDGEWRINGVTLVEEEKLGV